MGTCSRTRLTHTAGWLLHVVPRRSAKCLEWAAGVSCHITPRLHHIPSVYLATRCPPKKNNNLRRDRGGAARRGASPSDWCRALEGSQPIKMGSCEITSFLLPAAAVALEQRSQAAREGGRRKEGAVGGGWKNLVCRVWRKVRRLFADKDTAEWLIAMPELRLWRERRGSADAALAHRHLWCKKKKKKQGGKKESRGRSKEGIQRLQRQSIRRHNRRKRRRPIQDLPALCALQSSSSQRLRQLFFRVFLLFLQVRDQRFLSCLIYAKVVCSICSSHLRVIFASEIELWL